MEIDDCNDNKCEWKRPQNLPFPQIYSRFEGRREINGALPKFWIQDMPEEEFERAVEVMKTDFLANEPMSYLAGFLTDNVSLEEMGALWKGVLQDKAALICYMENPDPNGKPILAGMNFTYVVSKKPKFDLEIKGSACLRVCRAMDYVSKMTDCYKLLKVDHLLGAMGLLVLDGFHGQNVGVMLLKAREPLCKKLALKGTATAFTSIISQNVAEHAGFQVAAEISFADLLKIDPSLVFPNIENHTKTLKYMYKMYD